MRSLRNGTAPVVNDLSRSYCDKKSESSVPMSTVAADVAKDLAVLQGVRATRINRKDVMNLKIPRSVASALVLVLMCGLCALATASRAFQGLLLDLFRKRHK